MDANLTAIRHERSKKDFPTLRLDDDEYVEYAFVRARICYMMIIVGAFAGIIFVLVAFLLVLLNIFSLDEMGVRFLFIILAALLAAAILIPLVALRVFNGNKLFITNKHVVQFVMNSLVSSSVNVIDLTSVEDASFKQDSILQKLFHYGTFRLSTVGDETTYTFKYANVSGDELKGISRLVSDAKKVARKRGERA